MENRRVLSVLTLMRPPSNKFISELDCLKLAKGWYRPPCTTRAARVLHTIQYITPVQLIFPALGIALLHPNDLYNELLLLYCITIGPLHCRQNPHKYKSIDLFSVVRFYCYCSDTKKISLTEVVEKIAIIC